MESLHKVPYTYRQHPNRSGIKTITYRTRRIMRTITTKWWRSFKIVIAVTIGVGIAIAIIAASEGSRKKINELLNTHGSTNLKAPGIDLSTIQSVLTNVRNLLIWLSTLYTVASVGMVMLASMPQRRREISIDRQEGQYWLTIMLEQGVEAFILCVTGGLLGILLGRALCGLIVRWQSSVPMLFSFRGAVTVFLFTVGATFVVTFVMASVPATIFRDPDR